MLAGTPFFPSSMNGFSVIKTCADLLNFACVFLLYIYGWYSLDIITDIHGTKEKTAFGNLTLLLCKTTRALTCCCFVYQLWLSYQVIEYYL